MQTGVKRRGPRGGESGAPAGAGTIELNGCVGTACFTKTGENHHATVAQNGARGIPAAVRHGLLVGEGIGGRVVRGGAQFAVERIVLQRAAHHERAPIGENHHAVAEHVPADGLRRDGASLGIPERSPETRISGHVAGAGNDDHLTVVQEGRVNGIDGHGVRQGLPLTLAGLGQDGRRQGD